MTTAGPFIIRELGADKRVIQLVSRALPYRPFSLRTEQRVTISWLPGAPEATSTVLGAKEGPTTISGKWKQKYLDVTLTGQGAPFRLDNEPVLTTAEAIDVMDSFVRQGQLMEVTWLTTRRLGHIVGFDKQWENLMDCAWSLDFEWVSRGEIPGAAVFSGNVSKNDSFGAMETQFFKLSEIEFPSTFGLTTDFVAGFRDFVNNFSNFILDMESSLIQFTQQILTPIQVTRGLIATLKSVEDEVGLMLDFFDAQIADSLNSTHPIGTNTSGPSNQSNKEKIDAERYKMETELWGRLMRIIAKEQRDELTKSIAGELAGTYIASEGEDLRDVSRRFYSSPFEWRRLMIFNNLRVTQLEAGQFILVPRFSPDEANQLVIGV